MYRALKFCFSKYSCALNNAFKLKTWLNTRGKTQAVKEFVFEPPINLCDEQYSNSQILSRIPTRAVGVFAADQIPLVWTRLTPFIFNTQRHNKPGLHWVAIFANKNGDAWYFDSFGVPPYIPDHINRIRRNVIKFRWKFKFKVEH